MSKKYKMHIIIGIMIFLLISMLPVNTKGGEGAPWEITFDGIGDGEAFQGSVTMEIYLKTMTLPEDITIFVNQQKMDVSWDYGQSTKISFQEEGSYKIHIVHKNGYEETRQITVEFNNPSKAKITTRSYVPGTWSRENVIIESYGAKAISGIHHYEYKTGQSQWKEMKNNKLEITRNFDDIIFIRPVSVAGRQGEISQIWVRVWKKRPSIPQIGCNKKENKGWHQEYPAFSYELEQKEGPLVHLYAKLTDLETKETQTGIDKIPKIHKDGKYQLKIFTKDEALNESEEIYQSNYFVDSEKPEIVVQYENRHAKVLRYQKAWIQIRDKNLKKEDIALKTSGKYDGIWKQEGDMYQTEVIFQKNGEQTLMITAKDLAGNKTVREEAPFKIDTKKPEIKISGIVSGKSYQKPVRINVDIKDANLNKDKTIIYLNGKKMTSFVVTKDGYYTLDVKTEDLAGNQKNVSRKFTLNQKGIKIYPLQKDIKGKEISIKDLKPGFRIESLEPVQVTEFLLNGQKMEYEWKGDEVYLKDPMKENGKCSFKLNVKDATGVKKTSEEISFFYDTKKPQVKIFGLDSNSECEYGKDIKIVLENKKDQWRKINLDGKNKILVKRVIKLKDLEPGEHVLDLEAIDRAGNKMLKKIRFKVTKVLPSPVKRVITKKEKKVLQKDKKKQEPITSLMWILTGAGMIILSIEIIAKHRKHERS